MKALQLTASDNIATALEKIDAGAIVAVVSDGRPIAEIRAAQEIPYGFKVATTAIARGGDIIKYGHVIGRATQDIAPGQLVHVHNVEGTRGRGDLAR